MTEPPRKTLSLKKTAPAAGEDNEIPLPRKRFGKRLIRREQLPGQSLANTKPPPRKPSAGKAQKSKKLATHPKQPVISPSDLRVAALDKQLFEAFAVWRDHQPLSLGIEKSIYRFIAQHQISASKRVVQTLLRRHTSSQPYRENIRQQTQRYTLGGSPIGVVSQSEKDYVQRQADVVHSASA